jgi:hypothetical protein
MFFFVLKRKQNRKNRTRNNVKEIVGEVSRREPVPRKGGGGGA